MTALVGILGIGMHPWGKWGRAFTHYATVAAEAAIRDAGVSKDEIDFLVAAGTVRCGYEGYVAGSTIARDIGLAGIEVATVYGACASGAMALAVARERILSGRSRLALVVGSDVAIKGNQLERGISKRGANGSAMAMLPNVAYLGLRAARRFYDARTTTEDLNRIRMKNSAHGALNEFARFRVPLTSRAIDASPVIASPLRLLHVSTFSDGAAAVVMTTAQRVRSRAPNAYISSLTVRVLGDQELEVPNLAARLPATNEESDRAHSVRSALAEAAVEPKDLSLAELYDVSSVSELDWYEHIGLCEKGSAEDLLRSGATTLGGSIPVNPSGGLTCFGEAVAAQAIAQVCEATMQLRGIAGARQVVGAKTALTVSDGMYGHVATVVMTR